MTNPHPAVELPCRPMKNETASSGRREGASRRRLGAKSTPLGLAAALLLLVVTASNAGAAPQPLWVLCEPPSPTVCPDYEDPPQCTSCPCPPGSGGALANAALPGRLGINGGGCPGCSAATEGATGMPVWWVSEPCINLRLEDEPLGYQPPRGPRVAFQLSYRQRGALGEDPSVFGVGTNWSCSFRACG